MRLYAIGDVHGRLDLLARMHDKIRAELARDGPADWRIIHLGDYVDRGLDSKGVLDFLVQARRDPRVIALAGNHDHGFLQFLALPSPKGLFAQNGGRETAISYGVDLNLETKETLLASHAELKKAVPAEHVTLLRGLSHSVAFGDFFFCHAGIRPGVALERQDGEDLVWIRELFLNFTGLHPKIVVHGHTPAFQPEIMNNRVNVDTTAFLTGRLNALAVEGEIKRLLEVSAISD